MVIPRNHVLQCCSDILSCQPLGSITRGCGLSHSNIVQRELRRAKKKKKKGKTDTDKCLVAVGLGQVGPFKIDATLIACNKTCDS